MGTSNIMMTPELALSDSPGIRAELRLRFLPASARSEAMSLWRALELEFASQRLTCSSLWTETWLSHYGHLVPHQFVIGMRNDSPCGIALLTQGIRQSVGPFRLETWHVGTSGEAEVDSVCVEYNSLLTHPDDSTDFASAIWRWTVQHTRCDEFRMDGFHAPSVDRVFADQPDIRIDRRTSYYFDLRPSRENGEEPLMRLGTHTRANIRRTLRELSDLRCEWAEDTRQAEEMFHDLVRLHQARWNIDGAPGVYSSRIFLDFHRDLLCRAVPQGLMALFSISSGGRRIGCCQMLIDGHRGLLYQCGRAPGSPRISHGLALDYQCICESLRRGIDEVDFLAGDGDHKRRLSTDSTEIAWVTWRRPNVKNATIDAIRHLKRATIQVGKSASRSPEVSGKCVTPVTPEERPST